MEFFKNIRLSIAAAILRKRVARGKRKMVYKNFREVKTIGIVWNASKNDEFNALARFNQRMQDKNIDVKILGYYHGKHLPDQYTAIRYLTCIRKVETNLFYIPKSTEVQSFINNKFDILIDINFEKLFSLIYVTILSNASFKVGLYEVVENNAPFDLMMELKKPVNIEDYLNQVIQYLEMIHS
jgi:hypothetical protein